ncbi:hypothetical protein, partial [Escherichia coli]|uniref:hypothetical protein n=2 Tax=Escherichia coli TaxID=562 RepID=UPI001F49A97F
ADRNRSHWSTSKTPSYTKSVSWQHHQQNESVYLGTYNPDDARRAAGIGWRFVYFRMAINVGLSRQ